MPRLREERVGLDGGARLARHDHERAKRIEVIEHGRDGLRIGRVEDAQGEVAIGRTERPMEDIRGEAAAPHPGHDGGREAGVDHRIAEPLESRDVVAEVDRGVEPAQAISDGLGDRRVVRPQRRVAVEQPDGPFGVAGVIDDRTIRGSAVPERERSGPGRGTRRARSSWPPKDFRGPAWYFPTSRPAVRHTARDEGALASPGFLGDRVGGAGLHAGPVTDPTDDPATACLPTSSRGPTSCGRRQS